MELLIVGLGLRALACCDEGGSRALALLLHDVSCAAWLRLPCSNLLRGRGRWL